MFDLAETGRLLKEAAKASPYRVGKIAEMMGISPRAIYVWFRGDSLPSIDNLFLYAEIVEKSVDELVAYKPMYKEKKIA